MPTPHLHDKFQNYERSLAALGWIPDVGGSDTSQCRIEDKGILLLFNNTPSLFIRITEGSLDDREKVYESLVLGWNLRAPLTAVPVPREQLRVYNTTYKPRKEEVISGVERPVKELSLVDVLDTDQVHRLSDQLLLLSPDTWRSKSYQEFLESRTGRLRLPVDSAFIKDLQGWRLALVRNLYEEYPDENPAELDSLVRKILDEIIFIRFCEDRDLTNLPALFDVATSETDEFAERFQQLIEDYEELFDTAIFDSTLTQRYQPASSLLKLIISQSVEFYKFDLLDVDLLGSIYEQYLSYDLKSAKRGLLYEFQLEERKARGIYVTPPYIVEYLVKRAFRTFEDSNPRSVGKVLDPACGSGVFLTTALRELFRRNEDLSLTSRKALLKSSIYGIDIDERAVRRAAQSLYFTLLTGIREKLDNHHLLPELLHHNLLVRDSLENRASFVPDQRFDIIVSNPPYLRISGDQLAQYRDQFSELISGHSDLCWLMLVAAIDNLTEGGIVSFVVPDNLLRAREYTKIRKYILDTTRIVEISYLNYQAFESTSIQSILLILQRLDSEKSRQDNRIRVNYYDTPGVFERKSSSEVHQADFDDQDLDFVFNVFLTSPIKQVYEKIKDASVPLSTHFMVGQGIKPDRRDLHEVAFSDSCKKYLLGRNIQPYAVNWEGTYIDYNPGKYGGDKSVRLRDSSLFEAPVKLIVRKVVGDRIVTALDSEQHYVDSAGYVLLPGDVNTDADSDSVFFTLALLNSKTAMFYYRIEYPEVKEAFPQIRGMDIERLPFPNDRLLIKQDIISELADRGRELHAKMRQETYNASIVYQTSEAEEIENLVAQLYSLSEEDRGLIDLYLSQ